MGDFYHWWSADLDQSSTGDVLSASDEVTLVQQRVVRRLMTVPGDDPFNLLYGAGLPLFVGSSASDAKIRGTILKQLRLEPGISQSPSPPQVAITRSGGLVSIIIQYTDAVTGQTFQLDPITLE